MFKASMAEAEEKYAAREKIVLFHVKQCGSEPAKMALDGVNKKII